MTVEELRAVLSLHRSELDELGVASLAVFGSVARGEAGPDSDVDMLVEFAVEADLLLLARLHRRLSEWLGRPVDLGEPEGLKESVRDEILREAVRAA